MLASVANKCLTVGEKTKAAEVLDEALQAAKTLPDSGEPSAISSIAARAGKLEKK